MKNKGITIWLFSVVTFFITAFTTHLYGQSSNYGSWSTTNCFRGLDYCVKRSSYNNSAGKYQWWVKFRNRYNETISFSYTATPSSVTSARTDHRTSIKPGSETSQWFLIAEDSQIRVFVDRLRFGMKDIGDYESCDK